MGTVHGVYLKYVGLSALSYAGYSFLQSAGAAAGAGPSIRMMMEGSGGSSEASRQLIKALPALVMGYSTILNGAIAVLFKLEWGMGLIGKNRETGQIPLWSHILFFPFHIPTLLYTHIHTRTFTCKVKDPKSGKSETKRVPVATEVQPGWWVGGCYGHELNMDWGGIIDLTVEFKEASRDRTKHYLSAPTWDGVPATPAQLEHAANFAVMAKQEGDVLVHCAHGRGRSTTVMCACLVKAGLFETWEQAFEEGIKPQRTVCKLNRRMRQNLTAWQEQYVDGKKGQ
mmetsp:Transcript_8205/g.23582  ORF Transcript_8205/g.23582 Transcript_8205/m.23582 type:complete len:284 (+) Transcript_8205:169-1020(+)|eukprot:CAMPEP_0119565438 /NCGR_PEP_ID=MMETSP1352-20130426/30037_1 /TAXON_ID=265584 /ORGANISM="Stauroneis constricta, Strain CCMP1120" /LENGTH=283 /DNA_ID=CAMNT_0007614349 /DNA_START=106 /DNA_END=957 /DNA_ORIENTATION=+